MDIKKRLLELREVLNIDAKKKQIGEIKDQMNDPDFWQNEKSASSLNQELKMLSDEVKKFDDINDLAEIANDQELDSLESELVELEKYALFTGKYDQNNAIINFFAGAGGVDAQDWTEMLIRMYLRWSEKNGVKTEVIDESRGTEAGMKSSTIEFKGPYAYGKLRGESGVHRLVRQSPFNAKSLRQTSFALAQVMPEIESDTELKIDSKDLRIDTFCAGGHGGQSVNTTYSAVRITHLPTGIVAACQNERSQAQNKEMAMKVLRSRIVQLMLEQHKEKVEELKGNFSAPEWGNQIRSYVLHPYKLVKDHRTEFESTDPDSVLNGEIDGFIEAELRQLKEER